MSGKLTTHALNLSTGRPAGGMAISIFRVAGEHRTLIRSTLTQPDGRTSEPLLSGGEFVAGVYEIVFQVGRYFSDQGAFLDEVPIRFTITDPDEHYHVPLLATPWAYSTYRGS